MAWRSTLLAIYYYTQSHRTAAPLWKIQRARLPRTYTLTVEAPNWRPCLKAVGKVVQSISESNSRLRLHCSSTSRSVSSFHVTSFNNTRISFMYSVIHPNSPRRWLGDIYRRMTSCVIFCCMFNDCCSISNINVCIFVYIRNYIHVLVSMLAHRLYNRTPCV